MSDAPNSGPVQASSPGDAVPVRLRDVMRKARIEAADRTGVVVELRDAEIARLEILGEALDPLFAQIPKDVEMFDRGISQGETPRLWIDVVAHVAMGRDKRMYRFVQDSRFGRTVLAESHEAGRIAEAVTAYVARRLIEREHALGVTNAADERLVTKPRSRFWPFALGCLIGALALFVVALAAALRGI